MDQPTRKRSVSHYVSLVLGLLAAAVIVACAESEQQQQQEGPLDQPEHKTAVAEAQEAGIKIYWLGDAFPAGPLTFRTTADSQFITRMNGDHGVSLTYGAKLENGAVIFHIESYPSGSGAQGAREAALAVGGAQTEAIRVDSRDAELITLSAAMRPVNQLWLIMDVGETTIVAQAFSGRTGVPSTDSNPLIQTELLASVLETYLQPYPY